MLETLFGEAKAGNQAARAIFARAGRYLAIGLSNVEQLFDPGLIILSGERMRFDYLYAAEVLAEMRALSWTWAGRRPRWKSTPGAISSGRGAPRPGLSAVTDAALAH